MNRLMRDQFAIRSDKLKERLTKARKVTICLDGWSQKGLTVSYLGISACYFDPITSQPCHSFLNLTEIPHPHTGDMLAACLARCFEQWGITEKQVLLIVTDNGSNMVRAVRLIQENNAQKINGSNSDLDGNDSEEDVVPPELDGLEGEE